MNFYELLNTNRNQFSALTDPPLNASNSIPISLSSDSDEFRGLSKLEWDQAIENKIASAGAVAAVGGYLEKRSIYEDKPNFADEEERNIHIGVDIFMPAETIIHAPLDGSVHCFANRNQEGDYGPVIILRHEFNGVVFHTLYGHLSKSSLVGKSVGQRVSAGSPLCGIGPRPINGDWPPHLHFQVIQDLQGLDDNYPGVCRASDLDFYRSNCPDANLIIFAGA